MLKLKIQYFGHLMEKDGSLEKPLMLVKVEGRRRWGRQRVSWLDGITDPMDMSLSNVRECKEQESLACYSPWSQKELDTTEWLNNLYLGFPGGSDSKESDHNAGDSSSIPGSRRSPRGGNGYPLQYSCLENSMDRRAWWATVHGSQRVGHDLSNKYFHFFTSTYIY